MRDKGVASRQLTENAKNSTAMFFSKKVCTTHECDEMTNHVNVS